jgi:hypothetical protein
MPGSILDPIEMLVGKKISAPMELTFSLGRLQTMKKEVY